MTLGCRARGVRSMMTTGFCGGVRTPGDRVGGADGRGVGGLP